MENSRNIVFVGHVDHGKSSLLGRIALGAGKQRSNVLNAYKAVYGEDGDPAHALDQLREERERSMTIDTTEVQITLRDREVRLIDAPGHFELLRNMITGAARADVAVLVVAADAGIEAQTSKHLEIVDFLGARDLFVAVNKMDLVQWSPDVFQKICCDVRKLVDRTQFARVHFFPVCATSGQGVFTDDVPAPGFAQGPLVTALVDKISLLGEPSRSPSFAVQEVCERDGEAWLLGRVESGTLRAGASLTALPSKEEVKVEKLMRFPKQVAEVGNGQDAAVALNRSGDFSRGTLLVDEPKHYKICNEFSGRFVWFDDRELGTGVKVSLRSATQRVNATVVGVESQTGGLDFGQFGEVKFSLAEPLVFPLGEEAERNRVVVELDGRVVSGGYSV